MIGQLQLLGTKYINLTHSSTVASSGDVQINLRPNESYFYKILDLRLLAVTPGGTSSGTHYISIYDNNLSQIILKSVSAHGDSVLIAKGKFIGTSSQEPSDTTEQKILVTNLWSSYDSYLVYEYNNGTDQDQTNDIVLKTLVAVYKDVL